MLSIKGCFQSLSLAVLFNFIPNTFQNSVCWKSSECGPDNYCDLLLNVCEHCVRLCQLPDLNHQCLLFCPGYVITLVKEALTNLTVQKETEEPCSKFDTAYLLIPLVVLVVCLVGTGFAYFAYKRWRQSRSVRQARDVEAGKETANEGLMQASQAAPDQAEHGENGQNENVPGA